MNQIFTISAMALTTVATSLWACKPTSQTTDNQPNNNNSPKSVTIQVQADSTFQWDTLRLYAWEGIQAVEKKWMVATKNGSGKNFTAQLEKYPDGLYFLGNSLQDIKPILLGVDKVITLKGGAKFGDYKFEKSANNSTYESALARINADGQAFSGILYDYQNNQQNPELVKKYEAQFANLDKHRKAFLDSIQKAAPNVGRVVALYTYLSYPNHKANGQIEADYFGRKYLQFANLGDSAYHRLPYFYESIKNYTNNLTQLGLSSVQQQFYIDSMVLAKIPKTAPHYQAALLACAFGAMSNAKDKAVFVKYSKLYQTQFKGKNEMVDKFLEQQLATLAGSLMAGEEAPIFEDLTPEGTKLSLKDLRGKVVLIDFWASWCGPCRKENPNVVRMYQKYKDKGFEILGVSLDQDKQRWLDAIKQDQLTWKHVSDLKGWASSAGKMYGVSGIPFTVLIDKEGKVIEKGLRGPTLEAKLEAIFGK